jgi:hypothetical protein
MDKELVMHVIEVTDPLNGKTERMFENGEIPDDGTVRDLTDKELIELGFRIRLGKSPVGLFYKNDNIEVGEFGCKRFESIDEVKDYTTKTKAYTIGGKFGSHDNSYVVRILELPEDHDFDYSEPFENIYIGLDQYCYKNGRDYISREDKCVLVKNIIENINSFTKAATITPDFFETLDAIQTYISEIPKH